MHALRHVHRLLVAGGTLADAHPVTEERVETSEGVVGIIAEPDWVAVDLPNADSGLRQVVEEGLYELELEAEYDVLQHFDSADELIEAKSDVLDGQDALAAAIRATSLPLVTRTHCVLRRLRAR